MRFLRDETLANQYKAEEKDLLLDKLIIE